MTARDGKRAAQDLHPLSRVGERGTHIHTGHHLRIVCVMGWPGPVANGRKAAKACLIHRFRKVFSGMIFSNVFFYCLGEKQKLK